MKTKAASVLIGGYLFICSAYAGSSTDPFASLPAIPDSALANLRGGFTTRDGIDISVGLEQLTMIDGEIKTRLILDLTELGQHSGASHVNIQDQEKLIQLIQSGDSNIVTSDVTERFGSGVLTIIQNSLDMQLIQNITQVNVEVSNLSKFKSGALGEALNQESVRIFR